MVTENADFWRKIVVSGAWHPRRSETRVNYRGSSHFNTNAYIFGIIEIVC